MKIRNQIDVLAHEQSPLNHAVSQRDKTSVSMVDAALLHDEAMLAFQPIVTSSKPHTIVFYEGLIRIPDPTGRIIPAGEFIHKVEELETGRLIDCKALEIGLRTLACQPQLHLSINMSARSIGYSRWLEILGKALHYDSTLGSRLILEITESSAMLVPELVMNFMQDMNQRGIRFALDDFGSGATSFRYLRDFQFDILKIDGQFMCDIETNADNQVLVQALISIAEHFDMFAIAEAVETARSSAWLCSTGIDCQQGYFFGVPTVHPPWAQKPNQKSKKIA